MIYLDHNATSMPRPGVAEAMLATLNRPEGNPSSVHGPGRAARQTLDEARRAVARLVTVHESRVIFTSGGTEANHLAILGVADAAEKPATLVTSAIEHPSVLQPTERLAQQGWRVLRLPVEANGQIAPAALQTLLAEEPNVRLVSIMAANNETGVLQPIETIGALCQAAGVRFHCDATQWAGKLPLAADAIHADLLTLSAHKLGGPKGIGALVVNAALQLVPQLLGGGQERGRRSGTENLPGIAGFGHAATQVAAHIGTEAQTITALREKLEEGLLKSLPDGIILGHRAPRLPNTTAIALDGIDGETLVMTLDLTGFAISSGAACSSGKNTPSHVPLAMGLDHALTRSVTRISLGWDSTEDAVDRFVHAFHRSVDRLRKGSHFA
ncbi:MAG: cysteine desulfurase [Magnetococcales bacterium]|nr:cysteine desulfurase [Magnetococcales bacterium]